MYYLIWLFRDTILCQVTPESNRNQSSADIVKSL